jgi:DNA-binding transcriptional MerR regulator
MLTQKVLQSLLLHHSLGHDDCSTAVLFQVLSDIAEHLENIKALLEHRKETDTRQIKNVRQAMLSKVERQLKHLEDSHMSTINNLTAEVKAVKETLENAKSKFIGFE